MGRRPGPDVHAEMCSAPSGTHGCRGLSIYPLVVLTEEGGRQQLCRGEAPALVCCGHVPVGSHQLLAAAWLCHNCVTVGRTGDTQPGTVIKRAILAQAGSWKGG